MESVLRPGVCAASMQMDYDDEVAHRAVRKLRDLARSTSEQPFFLTVSFTHPHDPWELRPRYWKHYDPGAIDLPAVGRIPRAEADPHSLRLREMAGIDDVELTDEQVRTARHGYYAAISYVDERIGEVLGALAESGLRDETIVLFTADHGEMLGERGLWYKMAFFEPAAHVPLIVSAPGRLAARRVAEPVSLLDIAPTLIDLCELESAVALDGRSLGPALAGGALAASDVMAEYLAEGVRSPALMLRRGRFKYIWCEDDPEQLYDLESDPRELVNLADDQVGLCAELRAEVGRRWDLSALNAAVLRSQAERRLVVAGLNTGRPASWNFIAAADTTPLLGKDDLYAFQRRARLDLE